MSELLCSECNEPNIHWLHNPRNKQGHFFNTNKPLLEVREEPPLAAGTECLTVRVVVGTDGMYEATVNELSGKTVKGHTIQSIFRRIGDAIEAAVQQRSLSVYDDSHQDIFPMFRAFVLTRGDGSTSSIRKPSRGKLDYKVWLRSWQKQRLVRDLSRLAIGEQANTRTHECCLGRLEMQPDDWGVLQSIEERMTAQMERRKRAG